MLRMSRRFESALHHKEREHTTRKVYKDSAKPESVSDKQGGGSLDQAAKSDHKQCEGVRHKHIIVEVQKVARKQSDRR